MPKTRSAGSAVHAPYNREMNEWQKLGSGRGVRHDRFWVEVARRWRSALGHNRAVVKQHDFRECQKVLSQSLPSGEGSPGIGAP